MSEQDRVDRLVTSWLDQEAPHGPPGELLDDIVSTTSRMRPRPSWLARIEGHHMDVIEGGRRRGVPRLTLILALLGLLVALIGAAVASGAFRTGPPAFAVVDPSASPAASEPTSEPSATTSMRKPVTGDPIPDSLIGVWREKNGDLFMHIFRAGHAVCTIYVETTQDCSVLQWAADDFYLTDIQVLTIKDGKLHQVEYLGRNCRPNVTELAFTVEGDALRFEPSPPTPCNNVVVDLVRAGTNGVPMPKPVTNGTAPARAS